MTAPLAEETLSCEGNIWTGSRPGGIRLLSFRMRSFRIMGNRDR